MNRRHFTATILGTTVGILAGGAALAQPTLNPQGGSAGPEMDHSRMGGRNMGGPTPSMDTKGEGTSGAEMTHPGNPGTGHGHQQERTQRR